MTGTTTRQDIERIYRAWDEALGKRDLEASLSLYADDASIESPLVAASPEAARRHRAGQGELAEIHRKGVRDQPAAAQALQAGLLHRRPRADLGISARLARTASRWTSWKSWRSRTA